MQSLRSAAAPPGSSTRGAAAAADGVAGPAEVSGILGGEGDADAALPDDPVAATPPPSLDGKGTMINTYA